VLDGVVECSEVFIRVFRGVYRVFRGDYGVFRGDYRVFKVGNRVFKRWLYCIYSGILRV